jgi:protoporphyrinogen oxidase
LDLNKKNIVVIGAGPAGLTAAYQLAIKGHKVILLEASGKIGGMARSFNLWGQTVDCGPHRFFSSDKIVNDFFHEIVGEEYTLVNRMTRIYYLNKFFYYPLQAFNALSNLPLITVFQILWSYLMVRLKPNPNPITFEDWVVNRFGKKLFIIFFKYYSEKLWGIPCSKIDADWAAQRIKKLSLWEAVKSAVLGGGGKKHKTLVDQFAYPKGGTGAFYTKLAARFEAAGGQLILNRPVQKILQDQHGNVCGVQLKDDTTIDSQIVISTMPVTLMVKGLANVPAKVINACDQLYYRNTVLVYVEINHDHLFPDNWIYVHSPEVLHGRITNFRNWCQSLYKDKQTTILCLEYWCFENDDLWKKSEAEMGALAEQELRILKLIKPQHLVVNVHLLHIPKCYPVYETGYATPVNIVQNYIQSIPGLLAIGRYGAFKYNNQDHSILMGLLACKQIDTGVDQGLWEINTDSDYQEEGEVSYINKVG